MFEHIKEPIVATLPDALVYVRDPRRDGIHIEVLVVSSAFEGQSLVAAHRSVMKIFSDAFVKDELHALGLKTFTPARWEEKKDMFTDLH